MNEVLTHEEGLKLFTKEINENNLKSFENILPYFFLSKESEKRVIDNFRKETRTHNEQYLDDLFKMDEYRRTFIEVPQNKENDEGFKAYYKILYEESRYSDTKIKKIIMDYDLLNYEVYTSGKVTVNKQQCKLFKFLLQNKILVKSDVERITTVRQAAKTPYIIISRNPIDYLFSSTNQSFTSCMSLKSEHSEAFYMGLGALSLDPNRFLVIFTNGNKEKYTVKQQEFIHPKFLSRSWGIIAKPSDKSKIEKDIIHFVKYYPSKSVDFRRPITENFNVVDYGMVSDKFYNIHGLFEWDLPEFQDGLGESHIYLDNFGTKRVKGKTFRYDYRDGNTGCLMPSFSWGRGFEKLKSLENLDNFYRCDKCENRIGRGNEYTYDGLIYCRSCFDEEYFYCDTCDSTKMVEEKIIVDGTKYCKSCFNDIFANCPNCNEVVRKDEAMMADGKHFCENCFETLYAECKWCCNVMRRGVDEIVINELLGESYCADCNNILFTKNNDTKFKTIDIDDYLEGI